MNKKNLEKLKKEILEKTKKVEDFCLSKEDVERNNGEGWKWNCELEEMDEKYVEDYGIEFEGRISYFVGNDGKDFEDNESDIVSENYVVVSIVIYKKGSVDGEGITFENGRYVKNFDGGEKVYCMDIS